MRPPIRRRRRRRRRRHDSTRRTVAQMEPLCAPGNNCGPALFLPKRGSLLLLVGGHCQTPARGGGGQNTQKVKDAFERQKEQRQVHLLLVFTSSPVPQEKIVLTGRRHSRAPQKWSAPRRDSPETTSLRQLTMNEIYVVSDIKLRLS